MRPSSDDVEAGSGCASSQSASTSAGQQRKRGLARFNLRRLLYASPLLGRRLIRGPSTIAVPRGHKSSVVSSSPNTVQVQQSSGVNDIACENVPSGIDGPTASATTINQPKNALDFEKGQTSATHECPLCLIELARECFPEISTCSHRSCFECFQQYLKIEISESRVCITCPECNEPLHPNDIRMILNNPLLYEKYEDFMVRRVLAIEPDSRWCPAPDCSYAVIATGCASCPKLKCERPGCNAYFCYHCKAEWHPNQTCDSARAQRSPNLRSSSISFSQDSHHRDDIKPCPRCQVYIVKMDDGSCNHMTCAVCGAEFCWLCMKEISDLHYLSPSGCTFWGKKPWSRKKKLLWQLGTLVGAPVGIGLLAGIAIPAMIIGIPVWVGRKIYARYEQSNKHKRNFAIAGGVTASVIISPVLAGLAVAIGVPILLFYVYGVVPVSLCRSGGCGVSTSATGVRFEFDDETDLLGVPSPRTTDAASIDAVSHRGGNPSIGEASLSLGSGSHLERLGRDPDRESASNHALTGSIASNGQPGVQRLEVQADVASSHRLSMSSETASAASLSERSNTDDGLASVRALAGSVANLRVVAPSTTPMNSSNCTSSTNNSTSNPQTISATPVEVHADANSSSSLEDVTTVPMRRSRKRKQLQEVPNWSWQISSESELISERVRFDDHVRFLGPSITCEPFTSTESETDYPLPGPTSSLLVSSESRISSFRHIFPDSKRLQKVRKPHITTSSTESGSTFTTETDLKNSKAAINPESCPESKPSISSSDVKAK